MGKYKGMSLEQREKALTELLLDAVELRFSKHLVEDYNRQLEEIRAELKEVKEKQKEFRKLLKSRTQ